jgi:uncharacterized glyoxalase superfamily protein PhnB
LFKTAPGWRRDHERVPTSRFRCIGVHLTVADVPAAIAFYRRLGLDVPEAVGGGSHVEIDLGDGHHLALSSPDITRAYDPGWTTPSGPPGSVLQFEVDSRDAVDELYAELTTAGYQGHLAPIDAFWGNRYAEVDDPAGHRVGFHSRPEGPNRPSG